MNLFLAIALVAFSALYAVRAWGIRRFRIADRIAAIAESVGLLALFTVLHFATGWAGVPIALWFAAVALAAGGVAGLVLRFDGLPWIRTRRRFVVRVIRLALGGLVSAIVFGLGAISAFG
ncbi:hypothetical protein SRABI76_01838 [Microbacterium oxydans]|uniref:hypothetical protein n=1 Tax=Microbacterium oxydans TaxID=82380 RepID=UPI001D70B653|nr:hypothetical protein [Microbacterium oxydans]CAH0193705.1 hypothetical protein SRABI76_01838 [Microbacterium oxydans]